MSMSRREFLAMAAGSAGAIASGGCSQLLDPFRSNGSPRLRSRPSAPTETLTTGMHALGLSNDRDGFIYVPAIYEPNIPAPLLVLLHGAGRSSTEWSSGPLPALVDDRGLIVMGPSSRGESWDRIRGDWGPDVQFLDLALAVTFRRCRIDPARIALGGFSDGASYALSLGVSNGDLFSALLGFSPGLYLPEERRGRPRVFISHGTSDNVIPIQSGGRRIAPIMRDQGYAVTYREFDGGHTVTYPLFADAIQWVLHPEG